MTGLWRYVAWLEGTSSWLFNQESIRLYFTVPTDETATFPCPASFASKLSSNIPSLACHLRALRNAILTALSIACSRAQETSGDGKPDVRITQARKWMQMGPSSYTSQIFCGFYPGKTNHPVDPCMVHLRYLPTFWLIFMVNTCRSCK